MLKKTITYKDYNDNVRTEDHYFNLNESEITKLEVGTTGGLGQYLQKISDDQDVPKIMEFFEEFIRKTYGRKSPDGKRFEKSDEIFNEFYQTEAYSTLFMELITNEVEAANFVNGVIPKELANRIDELNKANAKTSAPALPEA